MKSFLALAAFLLVFAKADRVPAVETKRTNVLFLFADDQRADTIAANGNPVIKTPNLDSLARAGLVLDNAYCLGSNMPAVCTPSRNMLLSGRAYFRWQGPQASGSEPNFPDSMKAAGYETWHFGKPDNSATQIQAKFEHNQYLVKGGNRELGEPGQVIVDGAIEFLERRSQDRPFFMYLAFNNPHDPRIAAPKYMDLYNREQIPLPRNYLPVHPFDNGEMTVRDERLAPWPRSESEIRRHLHDYYAVISGLDSHIGRLLQTLKERGLYENTIIIYSADHGLAIGSHGLMGKQNLYEDGMKPPLIFSGPGIAPGRSNALVYLMDIYPTVCELVGAPLPPGLDGRSFAGVLVGRAKGLRETLGTSYRQCQRAIRDDRWKLIRYPLINKTQLFDLLSDPSEMHDLAGDPAQTERIERMMGQLHAWQQGIGDTAPLTSASPKDSTFVPPVDPAPGNPIPVGAGK